MTMLCNRCDLLFQECRPLLGQQTCWVARTMNIPPAPVKAPVIEPAPSPAPAAAPMPIAMPEMEAEPCGDPNTAAEPRLKAAIAVDTRGMAAVLSMLVWDFYEAAQ